MAILFVPPATLGLVLVWNQVLLLVHRILRCLLYIFFSTTNSALYLLLWLLSLITYFLCLLPHYLILIRLTKNAINPIQSSPDLIYCITICILSI
jgi:hypothetical protein